MVGDGKIATGTSQRGRLMWNLNHNESSSVKFVHPLFDRSLKQLAKLPNDLAEEKLKTYTNFLFVRDPIVRFVSGYLGKIRSRKFDRLPSIVFARKFANETNKKVPLSFAGFSKYLAHLSDLGKQFPNGHFRGSASMCQICHIDYTFIGQYALWADFSRQGQNICARWCFFLIQVSNLTSH